MKYLIGNWKANKTLKEAQIWIDDVKGKTPATGNDLEIVLCPSFIHIDLFSTQYPELTLGVQDLSPYGDGAYTGEITARMVSNTVKYAILGHSERYTYFSESVQAVAAKAMQALDNRITPIIAVHKDNWKKQFLALDTAVITDAIIMYEPPEAISKQDGPIGEGKAAPISEVVETIQMIKSDSGVKTVIYGGSIKARNIQTFMKEESIDGVLPGSASLNAKEWIAMLELAHQALKQR